MGDGADAAEHLHQVRHARDVLAHEHRVQARQAGEVEPGVDDRPGAVADDDPLRDLVREHGLTDDVRFTGYLAEEDFWRLARAADVSVNLRFPTVGETSGAVCRLAGTGLPVVVSDVGWFRELPDSFAAKVPIGAGEVETIAAQYWRTLAVGTPVILDSAEMQNVFAMFKVYGRQDVADTDLRCGGPVAPAA